MSMIEMYVFSVSLTSFSPPSSSTFSPNSYPFPPPNPPHAPGPPSQILHKSYPFSSLFKQCKNTCEPNILTFKFHIIKRMS